MDDYSHFVPNKQPETTLRYLSFPGKYPQHHYRIEGLRRANCMTFDFAKPTLNKIFMVYKNVGGWDLIALRKNKEYYSLLGTDIEIGGKRVELWKKKLLQEIFKCISPKYGIKLKGYVVGTNLIVSVDFPKLIKRLRVKPETIFNKNFNVEAPSGIAIYSLTKDSFALVEDVGLPGSGLIPIKEFGKKWGFIRISDFNELKIDNYNILPEYDSAVGFIEGYSKVKRDGYYGFIDPEGKTVVPCEYDDALSFHHGKACLAKSNHLVKPQDIYNKYTWYNLSLEFEVSEIRKGRLYGRRKLSRERINPVHNSYISQLGMSNFCSPRSLNFNEESEDKLLQLKKDSSNSIVIDPITLDFDLTQEEIDFMTGKSSLLEKYGKPYFKWKKECERERREVELEQMRRNHEDYLIEKSHENQYNRSNSSDIDFNEDWEWNID